MAFIVTARKWRPKIFSEVVGQEHITATLKNAIKNNRIAHAYIFTGPRGVGKTTTARILAKTLNCTSPENFEPCNKCEMCLSIQNNQSMDIIEIDGASNRGIDEIRTLRDSVKYSPTKGKYKVYIIDEVHMLTKESFNAFLKTLEEPPSHTIFIFATTDIHKVPLTIISRCQRFDFRRIQLDTIKDLLSKIAASEKIEIDDKTLTIIAKKADGALRDAESFFDQIVSFCGNKINSSTVAQMLNLIDDEIYFSISDAIIDKNFKVVFDVTKSIYENGWNFIDFMDGLNEHFRNIMTVVLTGKSDLVETADVFKTKYLSYADKFSEGDILRLLNFLNKAANELKYAQNQRLKVEISLTHLIGLERTSTITQLISQLGNSSAISQPVEKKSSYNPVKPEKPAIKEPEKKENYKIIPSQNSGDINLDTIYTKWESFVNSVLDDKGLTLGPFLPIVKVVSLEGNKLSINLNDPHGKDVIAYNNEFLSSKAEEIFGKKLIFSFTDERSSIKENSSESGNKKNLNQTSPPSSEKKNLPIKEKDPLIETIINELGGEELTS